MDNNEVVHDLQEIIDSLLKCKIDNKDCKTCELRSDECLKYIRTAIAVSLQFIVTSIIDSPKEDKEYNNMFT